VAFAGRFACDSPARSWRDATRCAGTAREGVVQVTVPRPSQGWQGAEQHDAVRFANPIRVDAGKEHIQVRRQVVGGTGVSVCHVVIVVPSGGRTAGFAGRTGHRAGLVAAAGGDVGERA
jgi:hypothetical protein